MKKTLLFLSLVYSAITVYGQTPSIPNGNMEQWTSVTCDNPHNYTNTSNTSNFFRSNLPFNVTKSTDAYHGSFAAQVMTNTAPGTDTAFGYFINANPNGDPSTWVGGMFYQQQPTGIRGYYKYNVATADSATIIVSFNKAGVNIGTYMFLVGGVHTTYNLFNFTFTPALTQIPDSVIFGAISCKLGNGGQPSGPAGSTLIIDSVSFTGVTSQPALFNGDFELWDAQTYNIPNDWYVQSGSGEGFDRTTDAHSGTYAIELKTYVGDQNNNPVARGGYMGTGYYPYNCNGGCSEQGGFPYAHQTDTLAFYYKYTPSGSDTAQVSISFKHNGSAFDYAYINLLASSTYQYKEIPFSLMQMPDSVTVHAQSSIWSDTLLSYVGSSLKIDDIHFKSQPLNVGVFEIKNKNAVTVYPNPTTGKIQVAANGFDVQRLEVYNVVGEKMFAVVDFKQQNSNEIDLSNFQNGIYFVKIFEGEKMYMKKIILQR